MSARVFWAITGPLMAVALAAGLVLPGGGPFGARVGWGLMWAGLVLVIMLAVDAVLNVRRSLAAYRDRGEWPGES